MKIVSIENLELLLSPHRRRSHFGVIPGSTLESLIRGSVNRDRVFPVAIASHIPFYMNDLEVIRRSDALQQARQQDGSHLFLGNVSDRWIWSACKRTGLRLICNRAADQDKFEDKIFFHRLMERHGVPVPEGRVVTSATALESGITYPAVLQAPNSYGSFGTFFVESARDAQTTILKRKLSYPLLCRRLLPGLAYGVTLLIDSKGALASSIRLQASITGRDAVTKKGAGGFFFGIQWVPTATLSKVQRSAIEGTLQLLAAALQKAKFRGIANIDFMLSDEGVHIIECNPRLSGATWQLAQRKELLHGADFVDEYRRVTTGGRLSRYSTKLPTSSFDGATLDLDCFLPVLPKRGAKRRSSQGAGIYQLKGGKLVEFSKDIGMYRGIDHFFVFPGTRTGATLDPSQGLGVILSNAPLYKTRGSEVLLRPLGRRLHAAAKEIAL